jgi:hypothetical protein
VITPTSGYVSANAPCAHFGLGAATSGMVTVVWPGGKRQVGKVSKVDRIVEVAEVVEPLIPDSRPH